MNFRYSIIKNKWLNHILTADILSDLFVAIKKRVGKELIWVIVGQVAAIIGGVVGIRLLTEYFGPEAYGELALGVTIAGFLGQILFGPLGQSLGRFYAAFKEQSHLKAVFGSLKIILSWSCTAIILLGICSALVVGIKWSEKWGWLILTSIMFGTISGTAGLFQSMQNAARQRRLVAFHQGVEPWLKPLAAISVVVFLGKYGFAALAGFCIASLMLLTSQGIFMWRLVKREWKKVEKVTEEETLRRILTFSYPFSLWGIIGWFQLYSDRWVLQAFLGEYNVGIYTALFQIGNLPIMMSIGILSQLMMPIIYGRIGNADDYNRIKTAILYIKVKIGLFVLLVLFFIGVAILFHRPIFQLVTANRFWEVSNLLPLVCLGLGLRSLGQLFCIVGFAFNKPHIYIKPGIVSAIMAAALNVYFGKVLGIYGICLALVISGLCYAGWVGFVSYKFLNHYLLKR